MTEPYKPVRTYSTLPPGVPFVAGGPLPDPLPPPAYTQDEAIAYECACECITHLSAIYTSELYNDNPSPERRAALELEQIRLHEERRTLRVKDHDKIARIRSEYGALCQAHLAA